MIIQTNQTKLLEKYKNDVRNERDKRLKDFEWRFQRYESESRQGLITTDSINDLDAYAQALRDITKQTGFPENIEWPVEPVESK